MSAPAEPTSLLAPGDLDQFLDMVERLTVSEVGPLVEHPEFPAPPGGFLAALHRFEAVGVLSEAEDRGLGVWDVDIPEARSLSLAILRAIARVSPAMAYAVHIRGIANRLGARLGDFLSSSSVAFDRLATFGGRAFGRSFADRLVSAEQSHWMAEVWGVPRQTSPLLVLDVAPPRHLWIPEWDVVRGWQFVRRSQEQLVLEPVRRVHGLDALEATRCYLSPKQANRPEACLDRSHVVDALSIHGSGLLAMATGAAETTLTRARDYANLRTQGGTRIIEHDAVAQLIEQAASAIAAAESALDSLTRLSGDELLVQVWRARAHCHPHLAAAGSNAMQVFGGIGYMRDLGIENMVRDLNTLRRLSGSPAELTLHCAGYVAGTQEAS